MPYILPIFYLSENNSWYLKLHFVSLVPIFPFNNSWLYDFIDQQRFPEDHWLSMINPIVSMQIANSFLLLSMSLSFYIVLLFSSFISCSPSSHIERCGWKSNNASVFGGPMRYISPCYWVSKCQVWMKTPSSKLNSTIFCCCLGRHIRFWYFDLLIVAFFYVCCILDYFCW